MKNKKRNIPIFGLIIIFIIIILIILFSTNVINIEEFNGNVRKSLYGDPIDLETGTINNEYFNINSEGENANQTTKGINDAIEYASKNNINYIKLEKGEYLVNGEGEKNKEKGILLKSNINLDLNNSKIIHETNGSIAYNVFSIHNIENVIISNGIIVGDKETHNYDDIESTHEWGYGIELKGANNVKLYNLQIEKTTGDGIFISSYTSNETIIPSENVEISNNNIYDCRRQGISITCGKNIEIHDNTIHDIEGTKPGTTIDLEPSNDRQIVENVKIYNNKLYNKDKKDCLQVMNYIKNIEIYDNEINGILGIYAEQNKISIRNNVISNGTIYFSIYNRNMSEIEFINKVEFNNNEVNNCDISILNARDVLLQENKLNNCKIDIYDSNVAIVDNVFDTFEEKTYLYKYDIEDGDTNIYNLYLWNNNVESNMEDIINSEYLIVYRDYESVQQYIQDKFTD